MYVQSIAFPRRALINVKSCTYAWPNGGKSHTESRLSSPDVQPCTKIINCRRNFLAIATVEQDVYTCIDTYSKSNRRTGPRGTLTRWRQKLDQ